MLPADRVSLSRLCYTEYKSVVISQKISQNKVVVYVYMCYATMSCTCIFATTWSCVMWIPDSYGVAANLFVVAYAIQPIDSLFWHHHPFCGQFIDGQL